MRFLPKNLPRSDPRNRDTRVAVDSKRSGSLITIKSGSISGGPKIIEKQRIALFKGVFNGARKGYTIYEKHIAKDTGKMRGALLLALMNHVGRQNGSSTITIDWDTVIDVASRAVPYTWKHSETSPSGKSFYYNPTTPGTEPYKRRDLIPILKASVDQEVAMWMKIEGLTVV